MTWHQDTKLSGPAPEGAVTPPEESGPSIFSATLPTNWLSLQGVHGGFAAALCVRAADAVAAASGPPGSALRAATFAFLRGSKPGPVRLTVSVLRAGRALLNCEVRAEQDDEAIVVARTHHAPVWPGASFSELAAPPAPRPHDAVPMRSANVGHFANLDAWLDAATVPFAGAARPAWRGWARPTADEPGGMVDAAWLTMLGDFYPPATFATTTGPSRAVTIEYAVQLHTSALPLALGVSDYVAATFVATHAAEGFAVEDGVLHAPDGSVLATTRQTRLAG